MKRALVVHGHHDWRESARRVDRARRAYRRGDTVIFSGHREAIRMLSRWAPPDYLLEKHSRSTVENVLHAGALIDAADASRVLVVTSWWHAPRAWMAWRSAGWAVTVTPARGGLRYAPAELRALWRALMPSGRANP